MIARIPCSLLVKPSGWRFSGFTRNISVTGVEFEAVETLVRRGIAVEPGAQGVLSFLLRRAGLIEDLALPCRLRYVVANTAGIEFTIVHPNVEQREALSRMIALRSARLD